MRPFKMHTQGWRIKPLLFFNALAVLLLLSFLAPGTSTIWHAIDRAVFSAFNPPLKHSPFLRSFWALANHRLADWIEDLFILGFYILAVFRAPKEERRHHFFTFAYCVCITALTILAIDRVVCRDLLKLRRMSPTLLMPEAVHINDYLSWIMVKTDSTKSFPGDHATTALMFSCSYAYLVRGKLGICALLYGVFLCLPRLIVGAHWFSDIVVGSGSIALFSLSWAFCSPLFERFVTRFSAKKSL